MITKENPEDFIVEEVYDLNLNGQKHCVFILEKKNWTTLKAIEMIADKIGVSVKRFNIAGQKDKQGITRQYVSCAGIGRRDLERVRIRDIRLEFVGYSDKPIMLGGLNGNKFKIIAKDLKKELKKIEHIPNYYDDQRFGGYRPNLHLAGKEILKNNYEEAVKLMLIYPFDNESEDYKKARRLMEKDWGDFNVNAVPKYLTNERKIVSYLSKNKDDFKGALRSLPRHLFTMTTQAYQSYIFNETLSRYLRKRFKCRDVKYSLGKIAFCKEYIDMDWPIVGYNTKLKGEVKNIIEEVMKEEGIDYNFFKHEIPMLSSEGLTRKAMVKIKDFKLGIFEKGKQEVSFYLPKGAYATIVLKAIE